MNYETIIVHKKDRVATLTLNRPDVLNAVNVKMFEELKIALDDISEDRDVRVMVLTGAGNAFCASFDMKEGLNRKDLAAAWPESLCWIISNTSSLE